ncbi:MAG: hydantoinase/oxoprolinase family protein [Acidimicrobiales bacterium]
MGVEIGGTFTDLAMLGADGTMSTVKVPSTPRASELGAIEAIERSRSGFADVDVLVHGSTIATNGVIERTGARVALLVTRGFADLLQLQRQDRANVYRLKHVAPVALVPRGDVHEVDERVLADGTVYRTLDEEQAIGVVEEIVEAGIRSIAVCLMHAYQYPDHELLVGELIRQRWPDVAVTLSHEITPEYREYERASTTVMSAYVKPVIDAYLERFEQGLAARGFRGRLHIMQSNGGVLPAELIRRHAVRTLLSGPAGGVTAACEVAAAIGIDDLVTFDMGGTSTDVCLVRGGKAEVTGESEVDGLPVRVPMYDIVTVGAGGGSLASVDAGGMLRVGPASAGADPGPACYGRGGTRATVTDANVVLGLVRPARFLGGAMRLDAEAAWNACGELGAVLGSDAVGAAHAIRAVANANMLGALRLVSTERGIDPRQCWLVCYGGAAAQHAASVAGDLEMRGVVVPRQPGVFSAYGLLIADLRRDWSAPFNLPVMAIDSGRLKVVVTGLRDAAERELVASGATDSYVGYAVSLSMRYPGQAFELDVDVDEAQLADVPAVAARFHELHRARYGHAAEHEEPEIVTVRVTAIGRQATVAAAFTPASEQAPAERLGIPLVESGAEVAFHQRQALVPSDLVVGPAVVEEPDSAVWVPEGWTASLHRLGPLILTRAEGDVPIEVSA